MQMENIMKYIQESQENIMKYFVDKQILLQGQTGMGEQQSEIQHGFQQEK